MRHRLALGLGKTLGELDALITNEELLDWAAYYLLEPWGYEIANFRHALNTYHLVGMQLPRHKRPKIEDFMRKPPLTAPRPPASPAQVLAAFAPFGVKVAS